MNLQNYTTCSGVKRKVVLHGDLGDIYGKEFDLCVRSPAEAIRLLHANFNTFVDDMKERDFQILVVDTNAVQCSLEMVHFNFPAHGEFHFIPVPKGAILGGNTRTKGLVLTVVGVALVATAFLGAGLLAGGFGGAGFGTALGTAAFGSVTWGQIGLLGLALALVGVSILLSPSPKKEPEQFNSFFYSGAVNSDREGGPVPLVYGRVLAGSIIIRGGLSDDQLPVTVSVPSAESSIEIV